MRILYIIHDFLPRHAAGSQVYAFDLAKAVQKRGHEVEFLTTESLPEAAPFSVTKREVDGIPVTEVAQLREFRRLRETLAPVQMNHVFREVLRTVRPDVVHYHHLIHLSLDLPALVHDEIPQVFTLHDYWLSCARGGQRLDWEGNICESVDLGKCARCMGNFYADVSLPGRIAERAEAEAASFLPVSPHGGLAARLVRFLLRNAPAVTGLPPKHDEKALFEDLKTRRRKVGEVIRCIDRFVAPSAFLGRQMIEAGIPEARICVSDYGFVPLPPPRPKTAGQGPLRVGYVGTLVPHKGVHHLVEAFAHLKNVPARLFLYGDPAAFPSYTKRLRALSRGLPVTFEGGFAPVERPRIYSEMDLLVLPSIWWENSPLTIHEAHLAGVPVAVPAHGSLPDLVSDGEDGLHYVPGDPKSLAGKIRELATDEALREKLRPSGNRIKGIDEDAEWTLSLYSELQRQRP